MSDRERPDDPLPDILASLQHEISRDARGWRRVRSWSTPARHVAALTVVLVVSLAVLGATPRMDLAAVPLSRLLGTSAALLVAASYAARQYLRPTGQKPARAWSVVATGTALLLIPVVVAVLPPPHDLVHLHPESFEGAGAEFVPRAATCLVFGLVLALPTVLTMLALDRHGALSRARVLLAAGVGALAGTLGLLLHCPIVGVAHRIAGHGPVAVVAAVLLSLGLVPFARREVSRESA